MGTNRKVLVSSDGGTEKEVFDYEVENLLKQGWKLKEKSAQPKKDDKKINKPYLCIKWCDSNRL